MVYGRWLRCGFALENQSAPTEQKGPVQRQSAQSLRCQNWEWNVPERLDNHKIIKEADISSFLSLLFISNIFINEKGWLPTTALGCVNSIWEQWHQERPSRNWRTRSHKHHPRYKSLYNTAISNIFLFLGIGLWSKQDWELGADLIKGDYDEKKESLMSHGLANTVMWCWSQRKYQLETQGGTELCHYSLSPEKSHCQHFNSALVKPVAHK